MTAPLRVAFTLLGGKVWTGGHNYLVNLVKVLLQQAPVAVTPIMLAGTDTVGRDALAAFAAIPGCECARLPSLDADRRSRLQLAAVLLGRDSAIESDLARLQVDVTFEAAQFFGWRSARPAIAWMPDLQHRFLPHMFSRQAWWKRELGARLHIVSGRQIMVSSEDTRSSLLRLYRVASTRVHAVPFALPAAPPLDDAVARAVADRYGMPEYYFFMPNQFWTHKNHRLVVQALCLLRDRGYQPTVLATGLQHDPRAPQHFPSLLREVENAGLVQRMPMPGMVPYEDLAPLMQASVALLNPSLFEGWSTTVEEARAGGVPMILSDLDVHREQAGDDACYFERSSPESLARVLASFGPLDRVQRALQRKRAREQSGARVARFARDFTNLVRATAGKA